MNKKLLRAAALTAACVVVAGAVLWRPAMALWRQLTHTPNADGMYQVDGWWAEDLGETDVRSAGNFAAKLQSLREQYLTDQNRVFWAIVPDKGYYLQDEGWTDIDYALLFETAAQGLDGWQQIDLTGTLTREDYYKTDGHWRQESLQGVLDALGQAMGFSISMGDFTAHTADGFVGAYRDRIPADTPSETVTWLTSAATDAARAEDIQNPDDTAVYAESELETGTPYDLFLHGASPLITITSPEAKTDRELIIFRDSFASALAPLLLEQYRTVTLVDIRYLASSLLPQYVTFTDQDVLFLYSVGVVNRSAMLR